MLRANPMSQTTCPSHVMHFVSAVCLMLGADQISQPGMLPKQNMKVCNSASAVGPKMESQRTERSGAGSISSFTLPNPSKLWSLSEPP
jgi:hypothetical protein